MEELQALYQSLGDNISRCVERLCRQSAFQCSLQLH